MKLNFEIHESHLPLWENNDWRYCIMMGGRGNGRSGTASRFTLSSLMAKEYMRGAIMRAVQTDIRTSCWGEMKNRISGIENNFNITENDMYMQYGKNSIRAHGFKASSGSLTARLKSLAEYNYVWIEEAEETSQEEFIKLDDSLRTTQGRIKIIFTLNTPPKNHWIINRWFDLIPHEEASGFYIPQLKENAKNVLYIPGTYRENIPNLDPVTVERYENYKFNNPSYYWQVIEGLSPETKRGKIYTGWQLIDSIPKEARLLKLGEDFGWFPDPACLVAVYYWNGAYIIDELAYGNFLSNEFLANEAIKLTGRNSSIVTIADSAEPKSIAEQRKYGMNTVGAEKGKDSVDFRIKTTSIKKIYVTRRSKNIWESYENYSWKEDRDGNPTSEPEHKYSHAMDAVSYAISSLHNKNSDIIIHTPPRQKTNKGL
jgi:phage terminase large subunit